MAYSFWGQLPRPSFLMRLFGSKRAEFREERDAAAKGAEQAFRDGMEHAAQIAEWAHMVPPDGGSPTEAEQAVAEEAALRIRNAAPVSSPVRPARPMACARVRFATPKDEAFWAMLALVAEFDELSDEDVAAATWSTTFAALQRARAALKAGGWR